MQLERYLYEHIPITQALGIQVEVASKDQVILFAPFANNINHKKTVFGGSLHSVATLACWCLLYVHLKEAGEQAQIVIAKSDIAYLAPIDADFRAICNCPNEEILQTFMTTLRSKRKARIGLTAQIHHNQRLCVDYHGSFVAIKD